MDMFNERDLLNYGTYNDYLDSFIQDDDMFYLQNKEIARMVTAFRSVIFLFDEIFHQAHLNFYLLRVCRAEG